MITPRIFLLLPILREPSKMKVKIIYFFSFPLSLSYLCLLPSSLLHYLPYLLTVAPLPNILTMTDNRWGFPFIRFIIRSIFFSIPAPHFLRWLLYLSEICAGQFVAANFHKIKSNFALHKMCNSR
jgi:hypothetical protein